LINLYYFLKKLRLIRHSCQRTVRTWLSSCHKMSNFIAWRAHDYRILSV